MHAFRNVMDVGDNGVHVLDIVMDIGNNNMCGNRKFGLVAP